MNTSTKKQGAGTKNSSAAATKENAQDKALNRFADMMIEKIESMQNDWKKPWFTEGMMTWPMNLSGRRYNGMNSLMLLMHCEKQGYKLPVFATFDRVMGLNFKRNASGSQPVVDADGNKRPMVSVRKGEKSFPVFITTFTVVDADGNKIPYDDYKQMSEERRAEYNVFPKLQVYQVFNIDQTNMKEARPEIYEKLEKELMPGKPMTTSEMFSFEPMDRMIAEQKWICPINLQHGDDCYFSLSKQVIVCPEKSQFIDGESFYGNLWHEMSHSTTMKLNRIEKGGHWGDEAYAREELVAELTAALVGQYYGVDKHLKEDSAAYLKSWLKSLKQDASFIKTVLLDVKRSAAIITKELDALVSVLAEAA